MTDYQHDRRLYNVTK